MKGKEKEKRRVGRGRVRKEGRGEKERSGRAYMGEICRELMEEPHT